MDIIYPMFVLVLLTFVVGIGTGFSRLASAKKGLVDRRYFRLLSGYPTPDYMVKLSRNFSNLFEVPVLFYAIGIILLVIGQNDSVMLVMAWAFVVLRLVHSFIHITYNHPLHRFCVFLLSSCVLLVMWIRLVMTIGSL